MRPVKIGPLHVMDRPVLNVRAGDTLDHPAYGVGRVLGVDPLTLLAEVVFQSEQRTRKLPIAFMDPDPFPPHMTAVHTAYVVVAS